MCNVVPSAAFCLAAFTAATAALGQDYSFRTVALEREPAPGTTRNFRSFYTPILNNAGHVAFRASAEGLDGIWSEGAGNGLLLIAIENQQAPGTEPGVLFDFLSASPNLNDNGEVLFAGSVIGPGVSSLNERGVWRGGGSLPLTLVARGGMQAPGAPAGVRFRYFEWDEILNDADQIAISVTLESFDRGAWTEGRGNGLEPLAYTGLQVQGFAAGVVYTTDESWVTMNNLGQTTYVTVVAGPGIDTSNNVVVWTEGRGGPPQVLARKGSQAPGVEPLVGFTQFSSVLKINDAGQVAFTADIDGPGVNSANNHGIWVDRAGVLGLLVRSGTQAPGCEPGVSFADLGEPVLSTSGRIAFLAQLTGPGVDATNDRGLWFEGPSGIELVAREGEPAPGFPAGVVYGAVTLNPVINARDEIMLRGAAAGPGITLSNDTAIWVRRASGRVYLVIRESDQIDTDNRPDVMHLRTVAAGLQIAGTLYGTGREDGQASSFNDAGQIAFAAVFTDGTDGIFLATPGPDGCPVDWDSSGGVDGDDIAAFFSDWQAGNADIDLSGGTDGDDITHFFARWQAGC